MLAAPLIALVEREPTLGVMLVLTLVALPSTSNAPASRIRASRVRDSWIVSCR